MKTKKINNLQKFSIYIVLIVLFVACSIISPYFLQYSNLINVTRQLCVGILIAYGEMLLIISGFLDLSVGSVLALAGVYSVSVYKATNSILLALIVAVATGVGCNLVNAFFIAEFNVPAFIATLGMQQAARGLALYFTGGQNILQLGNFVKIGQGMVGPVPVPVILVILVTIVVWYLVNNTRYGRALYAIGGSQEAARLAGLNPQKIVTSCFVIIGALTALGGIVFSSRMNSGQPAANINLEFDAITAVILGGVSFAGGVGDMFGTILGVILIQAFNTGLIMVNVSTFWQYVARGALLLFALTSDFIRKQKREKELLEASMKNIK